MFWTGSSPMVVVVVCPLVFFAQCKALERERDDQKHRLDAALAKCFKETGLLVYVWKWILNIVIVVLTHIH